MALKWVDGNCLDRVMFGDCCLASVLVRRVVLGRRGVDWYTSCKRRRGHTKGVTPC